MFSCFTRSKNPAPVVSRSRTGMQVHTLKHYWTIENFSKCGQQEATYFDSAPFCSDPGYKFFIRLYPLGDSKNDTKGISLYLNYRSDDKSVTSATIGAKFAIVNRFGVKVAKMEFNRKIADGNGWGWRTFFSRSQLFDPISCIRKFSLLPNDEFTIYCKITYVSNVETIPPPLAIKPKKAAESKKDKKDDDDPKKIGSTESLDTLQSYGSVDIGVEGEEKKDA